MYRCINLNMPKFDPSYSRETDIEIDHMRHLTYDNYSTIQVQKVPIVYGNSREIPGIIRGRLCSFTTLDCLPLILNASTYENDTYIYTNFLTLLI